MKDWVARISYSPKTQKQETNKIDEFSFSFDERAKNMISVEMFLMYKSTVETETSLVSDFEMRAFSRIKLQIAKRTFIRGTHSFNMQP